MDPVMGTPLDLHLASQGARQVLALVVQLFYGRPGDIVMIEEPEIGLHPAAQVHMAEMLADAVSEGRQILVSTHSHYLLLALGDAIRKSKLEARDLGVWEVSKKSDVGTIVKELPVTKEGYLRKRVSSFAKVDFGLVRECTKAATASDD